MSIDKIRLFFLFIAWFSAIMNVVFGQTVFTFGNVGVLSLICFFVLTFRSLKKESNFIILLLLILAFIILDRIPSFEEFLSGGRFILVFSALLPTMILVRSVSIEVERVKISQNLLKNLPAQISTSGFQIASHFFGSVINTGTFSILSGALPEDCDKDYRKSIAEACLRGMNTSATWSPFFVAFAVGQAFIDRTNSLIAIGFGVFIGLLFNLISLPIFANGLTFKQIKLSLACLSPVVPILSLIMFSVLTVSLIFDFTALSAVVLVMPIMIFIYSVFNFKNISKIFSNSKSWLLNTSDDIIVISIAMLIGHLISHSNTINDYNFLFNSLILPAWSILAFTPFIITLFSFIGIHPIITSTIALSLLSSGQAEIHPALIMQAHLVGWAGGTMSSVASLSILTCSNLFQVESIKLAFGPNLLTAVIFSLSSGLLLSFINLFL
jgi:hypothetical protein|tara:strand:+ start:126 stop:1442 length:1317 start_codon:yes stop_codon:yes gene_type:complete